MAKGLAESEPEPETQKQKPLASNFHQRFLVFFTPAILVSSRQYACVPACWCSCVSGTFSSAADSWQRVDFRGMTARDAATTTTISISISIASASYNSSLDNRA